MVENWWLVLGWRPYSLLLSHGSANCVWTFLILQFFSPLYICLSSFAFCCPYFLGCDKCWDDANGPGLLQSAGLVSPTNTLTLYGGLDEWTSYYHFFSQRLTMATELIPFTHTRAFGMAPGTNPFPSFLDCTGVILFVTNIHCGKLSCYGRYY